MQHATSLNHMQEARAALKGFGFGGDVQEALLVIAALIENYPYEPSEIHPDSIHSLWYRRIEELWRIPPGFRRRVFEHHLQVDYGGTRYLKEYTDALHEAQAVLRHREEPNQ
jgi:hypothetical protein